MSITNDPDINYDFVRQVNFNRQVKAFLNTDILGLTGPLQVASGVLYGSSQAYDFNKQNLTNCGNVLLSATSGERKTELTANADTVKLAANDGSFANLATTTNTDLAFATNNASGPGFILDVANEAIKPFYSGNRPDIGASSAYSGITSGYFGDLYIANAYLNNDATNTFFTLTSSATVFRAEAFGAATYAGMGTSSAHNLIIFTSGAGGGSFWLDTSKNMYPHNTGTSLGTVANPWENIRGNNYQPEGGQFNVGASASANTVLELGNSSNASGLVAIDFNAGISSAVDFVYRIINGADKELDFQERGGTSIMKLQTGYSYFSNQLRVKTTSQIDANIDFIIGETTAGVPFLFQDFGNSTCLGIFRAAQGTSGTPTASQSGNILGALGFRGYGATGWSNDIGLIKWEANQNFTDANQGTRCLLQVTADNSSSPFTAFRIDDDGTCTHGSTEGTGAYNLYAANYYQNSSIGNLTKTKMVTIGYNGAGTDFEFSAAADTVEQNLTLTNLLPAFAQLVSASIVNTETIAGGATAVNLALGTTSSGEEIITAGDNDTLNDILESSGSVPIVASTASLRNIYLQGNISGANWSTLSAGQWKVYLTYTDNAGL